MKLSHTTFKQALVAFCVAAGLALAAGQPARAADTPPAKAKAIEAWQARRFGMFIHWGPVSLTEKEISWSRANSNPKCPNKGPTPVDVYDNLYKKWNPSKFDAKEWVAIAQAAGMKYIVLTAKHCDGFLLWDSKVDDYNIMHTPFKRDVCKELADAAHAAGMSLGWYYSPMDWRDPDCRNEKNAEFVKRMQAELTELLTNYGQIDVLWFDGDGRPKPWDQPNTYALVHRLQPNMLVNNRLGPPEPGDFSTPEQKIGGFNLQRPWESCMTISAHNQWAWGGHKDGVKSLTRCIDMLVRCAGSDGNMLLNVGPMSDGAIAPEQADRSKEIGDWLAKYGESIYGTRGGPWQPQQDITSTRKGNTVFVHVLKWDGESIKLPALPKKIVSAALLSGGAAKAEVTTDGKTLVLSVPPALQQTPDTILRLDLDGSAMDIAPLPQGK